MLKFTINCLQNMVMCVYCEGWLVRNQIDTIKESGALFLLSPPITP
jgi:hypothetical protein